MFDHRKGRGETPDLRRRLECVELRRLRTGVRAQFGPSSLSQLCRRTTGGRPFFAFTNERPRQMAGFARCSRCNHALTSVHVEDVPAIGALPAGSGIVIVACPNCRVPLGTSIIGPARTDARSRFHRASVAKTHPGRRKSIGGTVRRLLKDEGAEAQPLPAAMAALDDQFVNPGPDLYSPDKIGAER